MLVVFAWLVTVGPAAYVLRFGTVELRKVMGILTAASFATLYFYHANKMNWLHYPMGVFIADALALLALLAIALRSRRHWPLIIAALHLMPLATPLVALLGRNLTSYALGLTQGVWTDLQMLVLITATYAHRRRLATQPST